jgi:protein-S-isoprenylcysteine O-methyltransferase Ste14
MKSYMARLGARTIIAGIGAAAVSVAVSATLHPPPIIAFAIGMLLGFVAVMVAIATTK